MVRISIIVALFFSVTAAQYVSFSTYLYEGCDSVDNIVSSRYFFPADGSCSMEDSNFGSKIIHNETHVMVTKYASLDCSGVPDTISAYPIDICSFNEDTNSKDTIASVLTALDQQTLPEKTTSSYGYAAFFDWWYSGCNATKNNYISEIYLYPADGSCFVPTGGTLSPGYGYKLFPSSYTINITVFANEDCSGKADSYTYPIDLCPANEYTVVSMYSTLPSASYWLNQGVIGSDLSPWTTVWMLSYFTSTSCSSKTLVDVQVQGYPECMAGQKWFCEDAEMNLDVCTDMAFCDTGCHQYVTPLSDACTATKDAPSYWKTYIDPNYSSSYDSTCAGN